jgi:hypothetical protein
MAISPATFYVLEGLAKKLASFSEAALFMPLARPVLREDDVVFDKAHPKSAGQLASWKGATFGHVRAGGTRVHQGWDFFAMSGTTCFAVSGGMVAKIYESADYDSVLVLAAARPATGPGRGLRGLCASRAGAGLGRGIREERPGGGAIRAQRKRRLLSPLSPPALRVPDGTAPRQGPGRPAGPGQRLRRPAGLPAGGATSATHCPTTSPAPPASPEALQASSSACTGSSASPRATVPPSSTSA